jgi:alanyl-tRNA synthetase
LCGRAQIDFDEFQSAIMQISANNIGGFNRPRQAMGGGFSFGKVDYKAAGNRAASEEEIDDYMQALRNALEKKYNLLERAFQAADKDKSGYLSAEELFTVVESFGLSIPTTHANEIFYQLLDKNGDGEVSYHEFAAKLKEWEAAR